MPSGYVTGQRYDTEANGSTIVCRNQRPECPRYLPPPAKRIWARIVPLLVDDGVLANTDATQLGNLCVAQAILEKLQRDLFKRNSWQSAKGVTPLVPAIQRQQTTVNRLANDFGLTLRARAFLGESVRNPRIEPPVEEDRGGLERQNPRLKSVA